jgi:polyhydroxybutyrate depolymerase
MVLTRSLNLALLLVIAAAATMLGLVSSLGAAPVFAPFAAAGLIDDDDPGAAETVAAPSAPPPAPMVLSGVLAGRCDAAAPRGDRVITIATRDGSRGFRLHVPPGYNPTVPAPLLVNFPGQGQTAAQQERYSGLIPVAGVHGFLLLTPEGSGSPPGWNIARVYNENGFDDVAAVAAMVDRVLQEYCVDAARVFATGISNGAEMAAQVACFRPDLFAAVAPVAGAVFQDCRGAPMAVVAFQGMADANVPFAMSADASARWAAHNRCREQRSEAVAPHVVRQSWTSCDAGADVVFYAIDGGGHTWPGAEDYAGGVGPTTHEIEANALMWAFFERHGRAEAGQRQ